MTTGGPVKIPHVVELVAFRIGAHEWHQIKKLDSAPGQEVPQDPVRKFDIAAGAACRLPVTHLLRGRDDQDQESRFLPPRQEIDLIDLSKRRAPSVAL